MKIKIIVSLAFLVLLGCDSVNRDHTTTKMDNSLASVVNPLIGSDAHGHVFVGASVPFGAVQLGPSNIYKGWDWCSGYHYSDSILIGFSHTHLSGTGCAELGDILIMPTTGALQIEAGTQENPQSGYASKYSHQNEIAEPGYYAVTLDRYKIRAELTATERVGMHKYTFTEEANSNIIIDLVHGNEDKVVKTFLSLVNDSTIVGYRVSDGWSMDHRIYFAMKTSQPFADFSIYDGTTVLPEKSAAKTALKGVLKFTGINYNEILVKVGISPVSIENALLNLNTEVPGWNFEAVRQQALASWNDQLGRIIINADSATERIFYTGLYHTMIAPTLYNDVNGDYLGSDKKVYNSKTFDNYTTFSLWDTYRAANPLYTLVQPERVPYFINSMLELFKQEGKLPEWHLMGHDNRVMIGYNAVPVIVDAYFKGIQGFDVQLAYKAVVETAMRNDRGVQYVKSQEFIPFSIEPESVAKALEYSIYDWGIAQMAKDLGKNEDYDYFIKRSGYYKHYFDPGVKFFKGKNQDGSWRSNFNPIASSHRDDEFCEGNAWQYLWLVNHDVEGLMALMGGKKSFNQKLDSLFLLKDKLGEGASADITGLIGMYAHGNEPNHHIAYLYAYSGEQWKTAEKVRYIMKELYTDKPDGLCGNEDCGQMSAWYIWSSLGFYPVNPQNGVYVFGSPAVNEAEISVGTGKTFRIIAHNNSSKNIYIHSVKLNGKEYNNAWITHRDIIKGGVLEFTMSDKPNKKFGSAAENMPQSAKWNLK